MQIREEEEKTPRIRKSTKEANFFIFSNALEHNPFHDDDVEASYMAHS